MKNRKERLMPGGVPRYIHIYDDGGKGDRYTVVFTGRYRHRTRGRFVHLGASAHPFHPQGHGSQGESMEQIDFPSYSHLGKKIKWNDLPADVKRYTLQVYRDLWDL